MDEFMEAVASAETAVEGLPKHLQAVAFGEALTWLLRGRPAVGDGARSIGGAGEHSDSEETANGDVGLATGLPPAHVVADGTNREKLAWAVVTLYSRGQEATTASVMEIIKDELSVTPPNRADVSNGLRELTPRYLSREKVGRGYAYQPQGRILDIFEASDG